MRAHLVALSLVVVGCTNANSDPGADDDDVGGEPAGGGAPGSGGEVDTATEFTFALPQDNGTVHARVTVDALGAVGRIKLLELPDNLSVTPVVSTDVVGFEDLFGTKLCDSVHTVALQVSTTSNQQLADDLRDLTRRSGAVPLDIPLSPLVGPALRTAAAAGARAAGVTAARFEIEDELVIATATMLVTLQPPDSFTLLLGETGEVTDPLVQELGRRFSLWAQTGTYNAATGAKDLLCDLAASRAGFVIRLDGKAGTQSWTGFTRTRPPVAR